METWNLVSEWTGGQRYTREACTTRSLQRPEQGKKEGWGKGGKDCL